MADSPGRRLRLGLREIMTHLASDMHSHAAAGCSADEIIQHVLAR
jgi:hypothetical protein